MLKSHKAPAALAAVAVTLYVLAGPAGAQVAVDGNASPDAPVSSVLTVNNTLVQLLVGAVIPLVSGFLLRPQNPAWVKVLVAGLVGVAANAFVQAISADGTAVLSQEWFVNLALLWAAEFGSYTHFWNPVLASKGGVNAATGPGIVGRAPTPSA